MSMYVHRCKRCGHIAQAHREGRCQDQGCRCDVRTAAFGDPELIPTFDPVSGARLDRVLAPGLSMGLGVLACSCDECKAAVSRP